MKKMIVSTKHLMILAVMMVMTVSANAMSYNAAKNEALFLSDKMAYELNQPRLPDEPERARRRVWHLVGSPQR